MALSFFTTRQLLQLANVYQLLRQYAKFIIYAVIDRDSLVLHIRRTAIELMTVCISRSLVYRCETLSECTVVDRPAKLARFTLIYQLLSYHYTQRLRLTVQVNSKEFVPSLTNYFCGSNWLEREIWDLFGILFTQHPDLRRILTDYGFAGHPLRKDFPTTGFMELFYNERRKQIIYQNVSLAQEFRDFETLSPWWSTSTVNSRFFGANN
jgi:NADH-quinone oxidoreductase subunit C